MEWEGRSNISQGRMTLLKTSVYEQFKGLFFFSSLLQFVVKFLFFFRFLLPSIASQVPTKEIKKNQECICTGEIKLYRQMCCAHRIVQERKRRRRRKSCKVKHTHEAKRNDLSSEEINTRTHTHEKRAINEQTG